MKPLIKESVVSSLYCVQTGKQLCRGKTGFLPFLILERQQLHFPDTTKLYLQKRAPVPYMGIQHSSHVTMHIVCSALKTRRVSWQEDLFPLTPICPVWSRLVLNCCEGSGRSVSGWVGGWLSRRIWTVFITCANVCACVHVCVRCLSLHMCVCFSAARQRRCWIGVSCQLMRSLLTPGPRTSIPKNRFESFRVKIC